MNFICDSSTLIALAETGTLDALAYLKQRAAARFFVPPTVIYESVEHPEHIARFSFSAFKIGKALADGVLEKTAPDNLTRGAQEIMQMANSVFSVNRQGLKVLQAGECEALAAYAAAQARAILVDEKTTRLFIEDPRVLLASLEQEYRGRVNVNGQALEGLKKKLSGMNAVRSTEILAVAFEKGYFDGYKKDAENAFHAALYAVRNAGCSITTRELLEYQEWRKV